MAVKRTKSLLDLEKQRDRIHRLTAELNYRSTKNLMRKNMSGEGITAQDRANHNATKERNNARELRAMAAWNRYSVNLEKKLGFKNTSGYSQQNIVSPRAAASFDYQQPEWKKKQFSQRAYMGLSNG